MTTATALYTRAFVLDCNALDSIGALQDCANFIDVKAAIAASGVTALKTTLAGASGSFEDAVSEIAHAQSMIESNLGSFMQVRRVKDFDECQTSGRLGVIFSFEAAKMLEGHLSRLNIFHDFGVLIMQLSYNHDTSFGHGCLDGDAGGLTPEGRAMIATMSEIGITLDLSHSNTTTTSEAIDASRVPVVVTHAGCYAVHAHPRNKRDQEMRMLAEHGGVMGIYMLPFLTPDDRQPMLADYVAHMAHALDVCGEDHVGIGTDSAFFSVDERALVKMRQEEDERKRLNVGAPGENRPPYIPDINTPRKLERVVEALIHRGYTARVIDKVIGNNFRRVFAATWAN